MKAIWPFSTINATMGRSSAGDGQTQHVTQAVQTSRNHLSISNERSSMKKGNPYIW